MITKGKFQDGSTGWKAVPYPKYKHVGFLTYEIHWSDDGECVAEVVHGEADARLIADAPNLLAVLNQIVNSPTPYNERELQIWYETARNLSLDAIAQHSI